MQINPIKNDDDHKQALKRLEVIFDAEEGTIESDEADILMILIAHYEDKHYAISPPDPIEAIKIRMADLNIKQKDLIGVIGNKSRVSEILNRKKKLTLEMIRNLSGKLNISVNTLIADYQLS